MDLKQLIKDYLEEAELMQLATSVNNVPWICSVWFAADSDLNIYWFSSTTRRHSEEVLKNPKVAVAIALPQKPENPPRGLQLEGTAEVLTQDEDITKAISVYEGRIFTKDKIQQLMENPAKPHKFYRLKPTLIVLLDAVNFPGDPIQKFKL